MNEYGTQSGRQRILMKNLWNKDNIRASVWPMFLDVPARQKPGQYLNRSAALIRKDLRQSRSWGASAAKLGSVDKHIDEYITVLLDGPDTRYILRADAKEYHRFGSKLYCTSRCLDIFLRGLVYPDSRYSLRRLMDRIADEFGDQSFHLPHHSSPLCL